MTKNTVCFGTSSFGTEPSWRAKGRSEFKTSSSCPSQFSSFEACGLHNSTGHARVLDASLQQGLRRPQPTQWSFFWVEPPPPSSSHDLSGTAGRRRDRASNRTQETPSAVANQPTSASGWTHHPGRRIGNVRPRVGTNTDNAKPEVQARI